ncbi:MAG TPA: OmpA family protein [Crenalkalicoccus sp.]|jgi:outer membrane protein OmpA-like peptidoglycan-associated protein|nr:OmpA family protein [Crenalkalicoccus sp.]
MSLRKALLAATMLALPVAAKAQPVTGLYVGLGAGANFRQPSTNNNVKVDPTAVGYAAVGSIGWGFGNGLRLEIEGNWRENDVDKITVSGRTLPGSGNSGYMRTYGGMVNALYDFTLPGWPVQPYLGVGVGAGVSDWQNVRFTVPNVNALPTTYQIGNNTDTQFAYQAIAGLAYSLSAYVPGLALTGEYRFYGTLDPKLDVTRFSGPVQPVAPTGATIKPTDYNHSILVGLRYNFGVAPPPAPVVAPAPAPAPQIARTYLVFFDWDRADLTDRARQIVAEAAQNAQRVQVTRIEVAGHADRSGTVQYNQRLSLRRAEVVAAELVRHGIPRNEITVQAFGESRPLVPTADGVREPQNRRVEIVLR